MNKQQIFQIIEKKTGMKKWFVITILIGVALAVLGFGGNAGLINFKLDILDEAEKKKEAEIELIQENFAKSLDSVLCIQQEREDAFADVDKIKNNIPTYYYKFKNAEDELQKLKDSLSAVNNRQYSQIRLDSFADNANIQYR